MARKIKSLIVATCVSLALVVGGCSANRINLAKTGSVSLEVIPSKSFDLEKVAVYQEDNNAIVKGQVWLTRHFIPGDYGHIDVERLDTNGAVKEKVSVFHKPRTLKIIGNRPVYFKAALSDIPQPGGKIRVTYHQPDNNVTTTFCSQ